MKYNYEEIGDFFKATKALFTWEFHLDSNYHKIELQHSRVKGKRVILVDGREISNSSKYTYSYNFSFPLEQHFLSIVQISPDQYDLRIDNVSFMSLSNKEKIGGYNNNNNDNNNDNNNKNDNTNNNNNNNYNNDNSNNNNNNDNNKKKNKYAEEYMENEIFGNKKNIVDDDNFFGGGNKVIMSFEDKVFDNNNDDDFVFDDSNKISNIKNIQQNKKNQQNQKNIENNISGQVINQNNIPKESKVYSSYS